MKYSHELLKYWWLDVDVLAEAIIRFRDTHLRFGEIASDTEYWKSNSIDPSQANNWCAE
jgi:hypothetical protein